MKRAKSHIGPVFSINQTATRSEKGNLLTPKTQKGESAGTKEAHELKRTHNTHREIHTHYLSQSWSIKTIRKKRKDYFTACLDTWILYSFVYHLDHHRLCIVLTVAAIVAVCLFFCLFLLMLRYKPSVRLSPAPSFMQWFVFLKTTVYHITPSASVDHQLLIALLNQPGKWCMHADCLAKTSLQRTRDFKKQTFASRF